MTELEKLMTNPDGVRDTGRVESFVEVVEEVKTADNHLNIEFALNMLRSEIKRLESDNADILFSLEQMERMGMNTAKSRAVLQKVRGEE
jgi:hypothetical protein